MISIFYQDFRAISSTGTTRLHIGTTGMQTRGNLRHGNFEIGSDEPERKTVMTKEEKQLKEKLAGCTEEEISNQAKRCLVHGLNSQEQQDNYGIIMEVLKEKRQHSTSM